MILDVAMVIVLIFFFSIASLALAKPLQLDPSQSLTNATLDLDLNLLTNPTVSESNTTSLGVTDIRCYRPDPARRALLPTNKIDCEIAIDNWIRGQDLEVLRNFSQKPAIGPTDIHLPVKSTYKSCFFYLQTLKYSDVSIFSLAEVYAEVMGPDGIIKKCLGQRGNPPIGGESPLGPEGLIEAVVTGVKFPANDAADEEA